MTYNKESLNVGIWYKLKLRKGNILIKIVTLDPCHLKWTLYKD